VGPDADPLFFGIELHRVVFPYIPPTGPRQRGSESHLGGPVRPSLGPVVDLGRKGPHHPQSMAWQPNPSATTDTTAVFKAIEKAGKALRAVEIIRKAGRDAPMASLGTYTVEESDNPRTIADAAASACQEDAEALGGEQRYELKGMVEKGRGANKQEDVVPLGVLKFGTPSGGDKEISSTLKEVNVLIKTMGEARLKDAETEDARLDSLAKGFQIQTGMMQALAEAAEKQNIVNANTVKMFELRIAAEKDERQERREAKEESDRIAYEERQDQRVFGLLNSIGARVSPLLPGLFAAVAMKIQADAFKTQVDAATKAKEAGINVEPPPPPPDPAEAPQPAEPGNVTITQESPMAAELQNALGALNKKQLDGFKKIVGEDVWSIFVAAMAADTDTECAAILRRTPLAVRELGSDGIARIMSALQKLPADVYGRVDAVFTQAGVDWKAAVTA
jgi:hypothetical protein